MIRPRGDFWALASVISHRPSALSDLGSRISNRGSANPRQFFGDAPGRLPSLALSVVSLPANLTTTSPSFRPAFSAGLPSLTPSSFTPPPSGDSPYDGREPR